MLPNPGAVTPVYNDSLVLEGYIAVGYKTAWHPAPGGETWWHQPDAWVMKLDRSLDMVWGSTFGMEREDWANAILQNSAGFLFSGNLSDLTPFYGGWLFQTDNTGSGIWSISRYWYCSRVDEIDPLRDPCPEPNIPTGDGTRMGKTIHAMLPTADGGCTTADGSRMIKWDSSGNWVWSASAGAASIVESDGDFFGAGVVTTGVNETAIGFTRVSAAGEVLWSSLYGQNATGPDYNWSTEFRKGLGLVQAPDGGYFLAGRVEMFETGSQALWLIKTRPGTEGELDWALDLPGVDLHSARPTLVSDDGDLIMVGSIACDGETRLLVIRVGTSDLQAPEAAFTMTPGTPYSVDQQITFDAGPSSDPDGTVRTFEWKFGDGTMAVGPTVTHRYALAGDYTIELKVMDDDGTVDATDQDPTYTYEDRGTFSVRLEVTDNVGSSDTFVCEDCILTFVPGIYSGEADVEILAFSVTDDADAQPETYDFQLAPEGLDEEGAFGFSLEATGPDGSHAFRITFPSPYDPSMILYKLPAWEEIDYTPIDAYTVEVVLQITGGELDPAFVLAADLPLKPLTISVEGNGTTDPAPGSYSYYVGGSLTVTVTAFADACWRLARWSGAVAGTDNPAVVELNRYSVDTSITAHFEASPLIGADYDCDGDVDGADLAALAARGAAITPEQVQAMAANLGATE